MSHVLEFQAVEEPVFHQRHYSREFTPRSVRGTFDLVTGIFYEELSDAPVDHGPHRYATGHDYRRPPMTPHPGAHDPHFRPYHFTPNHRYERSPGRTVTFAEGRQA